jgi:hypothetical protein
MPANNCVAGKRVPRVESDAAPGALARGVNPDQSKLRRADATRAAVVTPHSAPKT